MTTVTKKDVQSIINLFRTGDIERIFLNLVKDKYKDKDNLKSIRLLFEYVEAEIFNRIVTNVMKSIIGDNDGDLLERYFSILKDINFDINCLVYTSYGKSSFLHIFYDEYLKLLSRTEFDKGGDRFLGKLKFYTFYMFKVMGADFNTKNHNNENILQTIIKRAFLKDIYKMEIGTLIKNLIPKINIRSKDMNGEDTLMYLCTYHYSIGVANTIRCIESLSNDQWNTEAVNINGYNVVDISIKSALKGSLEFIKYISKRFRLVPSEKLLNELSERINITDWKIELFIFAVSMTENRSKEFILRWIMINFDMIELKTIKNLQEKDLLDMDYCNDHGSNLLIFALKHEYNRKTVDVDKIMYIIKNTKDINRKDMEGDTALIKFLKMGNSNIEIVRELIKFGADPNSRNLKMESPISFAMLYQNFELIELLLSHGAIIHDISNDIFNKISNDYKIIKLVIESRKNTDFLDKNAEKLIYNAVVSGNYEMIDLLISYGVDISKNINPLLEIAIKGDYCKLVKFFLDNGFSVDQSLFQYITSEEMREILGCNKIKSIYLDAESECKVCLNKIGVIHVIDPCGHSGCGECLGRLKNCHMCNTHVKCVYKVNLM